MHKNIQLAICAVWMILSLLLDSTVLFSVTFIDTNTTATMHLTSFVILVLTVAISREDKEN